MSEFIENFHFIRPLWLLAIPVVVLIVLRRVRQHRTAGWAKHIANDKLPYLAIGSTRLSAHRPWLLLPPLLLVCAALAGPTWQSLPGSVAGNRQAMVILFDLSPSMLAQDLKPNRLERARLKLIDLLRTRVSGETALIVYSGDAYRVTPLTDDPVTIEALVPTLHPSIMPVTGSHPETAVSLALTLFDGAGLSQGDIVLVTDGVHPSAAQSIKRTLARGYRLSILGVGTLSGAPIPLDNAGFMRDANEQIIIASLDEAQLMDLAEQFNGRYRRLTADSSDVEYLGGLSTLPFSARIRSDVQTFDSEHDAGYLLVLLLLPMAAYLFRRNLVWVLLPIVFVPAALFPTDSHAWSWTALWLNSDQQAERALNNGQPELAAELFVQAPWVAVAKYRTGDFSEAANLFAMGQGADDFYNLGNAQAMSGHLERALLAYDKALVLEPDHADALYNREFLQTILRQRNEQEEDDSNQQNQRGTGAGEADGESADAQQSQMTEASGAQEQIGGTAGAQQTLNQQARADAGQSNSSSSHNEQEAGSADDATPVQSPGAITDRELDDGTTADSGALRIENSESSVLNPYSEQWLRTLPKDPGGFLRRKFHYQAQIRAGNDDSEPVQLDQGRY